MHGKFRKINLVNWFHEIFFHFSVKSTLSIVDFTEIIEHVEKWKIFHVRIFFVKLMYMYIFKAKWIWRVFWWFFRSLSYSLLHRNDLLWNSSLLSRSGHRSISGIWRHDSCGPIVSSTERRWHSYDVSRIFLRHLLLRHYSLDNLLHDCHFHGYSGFALGYLWYVLDYR